MKKSKFGLALGIGVVLSMSMIVLAAGPSCKTTITNGGKTASGSTSMSSANFCSAVITATQESGEEKKSYTTGVAGTTATVTTSSSDPFYFASFLLRTGRASLTRTNARMNRTAARPACR